MSGIPLREVYLSPSFDSTKLKVAQLRGILHEHTIYVPSTAKKADLVALFEENVRSKADDILSEASQIQPSGNGIVHIDNNGEEIVQMKTPKKRGRPSKAAVAAAAAAAAATPMPQAIVAEDKPRNRRITIAPGSEAAFTSAAKPNRRKTLGGALSQTSSSSNDLLAPSSTEDEAAATASADIKPKPKKTTSRRSLAPSSSSSTGLAKTPSISVLNEDSEADEVKHAHPHTGKLKIGRLPELDEEAAFSDYNPFQSDASPMPVPMKDRKKRKSSMRAQPLSSEHEQQQDEEQQHEQDQELEQDAHIGSPQSSPTRQRLSGIDPASLKILPRETPSKSPKKVADVTFDSEIDAKDDSGAEVDVDVQAMNEQNQLVGRRLGDLTKRVEHKTKLGDLTKRVEQTKMAVVHRTAATALPLTGLALAFLAWVYNYQNQSVQLGYCDSGSNTNSIIMSHQYKLSQARACVLQRDRDMEQALKAGEEYKMRPCAFEEVLPFFPLIPSPTACTPCPPHAQCEETHFIKCDLDYVEKEHPLAWLGAVADGLPGLGSVAFPKTCEKDYKRKKQVLEIARAVENKLAIRHGEVLCEGGLQRGVPEVVALGYKEQELLNQFLGRTTMERDVFILSFEEAIGDLLDHGDANKLVDQETGESWIAGTRAEMPLSCRARLAVTTKAKENRQPIALGSSAIALLAYLRFLYRSKKAENEKVKELVQVALDRLQDQQYRHYVDPSLAPEKYILPDQLRDFVLAALHIPARRKEIWDKRVRPIIESNANVRVSEKEINGDTWPTWEWIGLSKIDQASMRNPSARVGSYYPVA